jgi:hypothetical protein
MELSKETLVLSIQTSTPQLPNNPGYFDSILPPLLDHSATVTVCLLSTATMIQVKRQSDGDLKSLSYMTLT